MLIHDYDNFMHLQLSVYFIIDRWEIGNCIEKVIIVPIYYLRTVSCMFFDF